LQTAARAIDRQQARVDVSDFAVGGLNLGKNKTEQDDFEFFTAGQRSNDVLALARLGEDLLFFGMNVAVHISQVIRQRC
jgi:hypothetical protein